MASESIAHSASWAIDSEPIRARGIIVRYYVFEQSQKERRWKKKIFGKG